MAREKNNFRIMASSSELTQNDLLASCYYLAQNIPDISYEDFNASLDTLLSFLICKMDKQKNADEYIAQETDTMEEYGFLDPLENEYREIDGEKILMQRNFPKTRVPVRFIQDEDLQEYLPYQYSDSRMINLYRCAMNAPFNFIKIFIYNVLLELNVAGNDDIPPERLPEKLKEAIFSTDRIQFLSDAVELSKDEADFLLILHRFSIIKHLGDTFRRKNIFNIAKDILNMKHETFRNILRSTGKLRKNGFILDEGIDPDLNECIFAGSLESYFRDLFEPIDCSSCYSLDSFEVEKNTTSIMKKLVSGKNPVSILLYGKPGSGKTEYAKSILHNSGKKGFIFRNDLELIDSKKILFRLNCYLSLDEKNKVLIIDEADRILKTVDSNGFFEITANQNKSLINKMLEESKVSTIWIVNYSSMIDASTKRRFNFSHKFENMSSSQLRSIAESKLSILKKSTECKNKILELFGKYNVTGQSVENVIKTIDCMKNIKEEKLISIIDNVLQENQNLLTGAKKMRQDVGKNYDLKILNTSVKADEIISLTQNALKYAESNPHAKKGIRMLFYGLSGTGKTELVRCISQKLGREILLKRVSDIMDKYVGGTEKNISEAFAQASATNSILLFDEADSFFADRNNSEHSWERTQVNELLTQMEEFDGILICTTNLKKIMDSAMQRRFHISVEFHALEKNGIRVLLGKYFSQFDFSEDEIENLDRYNSVTPGDFNSLSERIRFMNPSDINSKFVLEELERIQREKNSFKESNRSIGFCLG